MGDPKGALECYEQAIALEPQFALAHFNRGKTLHALKELHLALESFEQARTVAPDMVEVYVAASNVLMELRQTDAAIACLECALELAPDSIDALDSLGRIWLKTNRPQTAREIFDRAVGLEPDEAEHHNHLGRALAGLGKPESALLSYDRALELRPDHLAALANRGLALEELGRWQEALGYFDRAVELDPDYWHPRLSRAHGLLRIGDMLRGWSEYEWRRQAPEIWEHERRFVEPVWSGSEPVDGRTILLYSEQGLGDTLQFCRYAALVAKLGARVVLEVQPLLTTVIARLAGVAELVSQGDALPPCDLRCPLISLPLALGTMLETIPNQVPYLFSEPQKVDGWRDRLGPASQLRVGLVWSGGHRPNQPEAQAVNERRNIPLQKLAPLHMDGVTFYSLQKGQPAEAELPALVQAGWSGPPIINLTAGLHDFSDTAALIDNLDLVISVDTSTAHLAGAMGKPVWVLNRFDTCWRWMLERDDSPWYPTLKLYRQTTPGDWATVVERVRDDLEKLVHAHRKREIEHL